MLKTLIASTLLAMSVAASATVQIAPLPAAETNAVFGRMDTNVSEPRVADGTGWFVADSYGGARAYLYNCGVNITTDAVNSANFPTLQHLTLKCGDSNLSGPAYPDYASKQTPAYRMSSADVLATVSGTLVRDGVPVSVSAVLNIRYLANHVTGALQYDILSGEVYW